MRYRALFALLVPLALGGDYTPTVMDDSSIRTAVAAWLSNATAAEAAYPSPSPSFLPRQPAPFPSSALPHPYPRPPVPLPLL